jgi:hypothetical protein
VAVILGLPPELSTVPPAPASPDAEDADARRDAWRAWRQAVHEYRTLRHIELQRHPDLIPFEAAKCAQDPAYWMAIWLRVFEPRQRASGYGYLPFIPFAAQVNVLNRLRWVLEQEDQNADAIWSKSRGWGASWLGCVFGLWGWAFSHYWPGAPPWNVLYLSRKEEYVDSKQQRSLFWKIRRLMRDMPAWQLPTGFNPDLHDQKGIIINPQNGNELGGESTNTKAGRGDRVTFAWPDEMAAMPNALTIWSTLAETTDHRIGVSTENNEEGTDFYDLGIGRQSGDDRPHLIETEWWDNPLNDQEWFDRQKSRYGLDTDAFNREILRDPFAGSSTWVYPWARTKEPDQDVVAVSGWPSFISIDPGFRDPTALVAIQETPDGKINVVDAYALEGKEADYFVPLLKPEYFAADDPNWMEKSYLTWTPVRMAHEINAIGDPGESKSIPIDGAPQFEYQEREIAFARSVAILGKPTYIGDTYGETLTGATNDSVYSRWRKYGIYVNRDRLSTGDISNEKKRTRTFAGRREALNDRANRVRFGTTDGAKVCLKALKDNKYKPRSDRPTQAEPKVPLHDWTSHYVTALEFFAVHIRNRHAVLGRDLSTPVKGRLGGQISNLGTQRAYLRPLPTIRGDVA